MSSASARVWSLMGFVATVLACDAPHAASNDPVRPDRIEKPTRAVLADADTAGSRALGARLFEDRMLSRDSTVACATCHTPSHAFTEPRPLSHGIGLHARKRNAPSLINVARFQLSFDWDGHASTLEDQLRGVFSATGDMGIDLGEAVARVRGNRDYDPEFRRVYGRRADIPAVLAALADYQRSLNVRGSRFERFYLGGDSTALSAAERRGWVLFRTQRAGCAGCHIPLTDPMGSDPLGFSDSRFHNLGVGYRDGRMDDVGRYSVTRRPSDWGRFRTPSLLNVELTAPYMHDGSLATLEDVIDFYARGGIRNPNLDDVMGPRKLSKRDRSDLVAFLKTLTTTWLVDSATVRQRLIQFDGSAAPAARTPKRDAARNFHVRSGGHS